MIGNTLDKKGKLYLIPTTLGDTAPLEVLPISIKRAIENIDYYIAENEKTARRFIKKLMLLNLNQIYIFNILINLRNAPKFQHI